MMTSAGGPGSASGPAPPGNFKVEFVYDYIGRRVAKRVYTYGGGQWTLTKHRKFVWAGWLMLMELDSSGGTEQCGTGYQPVGAGDNVRR